MSEPKQPPKEPLDDPDADADIVGEVKLGPRSRKIVKQLRLAVREELAESEKRILEEVEKRMEAKFGAVREVAEVEKRSADHARKKADIKLEEELAK